MVRPLTLTSIAPNRRTTTAGRPAGAGGGRGDGTRERGAGAERAAADQFASGCCGACSTRPELACSVGGRVSPSISPAVAALGATATVEPTRDERHHRRGLKAVRISRRCL